ncbi:hypothetical protein [Acinetobacter brisouii]
MPKIIQHIDAIARNKGRDVLFVGFDENCYPNYDYENWVVRTQFINWLEHNNIDYMECSSVANENLIESYKGQIYIDVPYDKNDRKYAQLKNYLENSDGSPRIIGILFYLLPLEIAIKNKNHNKTVFLR